MWDLQAVMNEAERTVLPRPFLLYGAFLGAIILGDHYGVDKTRQIYNHWYRDQINLDGGCDIHNDHARKWFFKVDGAVYPSEPNMKTIRDWF